MHRVRQSVSYFEELGWKPTVVVVDPIHTESVMDPLLTETLPEDLSVIEVKAFSTRWTRKLGLGSLALRSLWFYFRKVNQLLEQQRFDLIYFSTTMFPVMILGAYWKKRFGVPYVIDMQDPWHTDHYLSLPKDQRPAKFWFSYRLNKYLEPLAMKSVDGIVSVSQGYVEQLSQRYSNISAANSVVIPFGAFPKDFEILASRKAANRFFSPSKELVHVVYVGRGGHDMEQAMRLISRAFKKGLNQEPALFKKVRIHFVGTSYAPAGLAEPTLKPVADQEGIGEYVKEHPQRVPYFESLQLLLQADMLLIPGSTDPNYTASKLYPYIMACKPVLAAFHKNSSVVRILRDTSAGAVVEFGGDTTLDDLEHMGFQLWSNMLRRLPFTPPTNWQAFKSYKAAEMSKRQIDFFNFIVGHRYQVENQVPTTQLR